jgi:hypothetical protein
MQARGQNKEIDTMENILTKRAISGHKINWRGLALVAALVLLAGLGLWMVASQVAGGLSQQRQAKAQAAFEEQTGVRILRVVMTAGGGMVDIQYQVLDPDKSLIMHDDDNPPTLEDEATGHVVAIPFHDHSFRELHTAVKYHEIIMNGGGLLRRGSKVRLTVADSRLEHLVVQ